MPSTLPTLPSLGVDPVNVARTWMERRFAAAGLSPETLQLPCGSVHCWVGGTGPPLVLLQGFGGAALWQWGRQVGPLARHFRLYVPDLLFFGQSSSPSSERSLEFQAAMVEELLSHFGVAAAHVLGISYGGFVSLMLASSAPERVQRLVLVDCPGPIMTRADYDGLLGRYDVPQIEDVLLPARPDQVRRLVATAWHRPPWIPGFLLPPIHQALFTTQVEEKRGLLRRLLGYMDEPAIEPRTVGHETLAVWGRHDRIFPVEMGERLVARLGGSARLEVLERAAHAPNLERPRAFNRLVIRFLRQGHRR